MATNRGKIHGGKCVLNVHMASGEFGEITRGETTRFYCTCTSLRRIRGADEDILGKVDS